MHKIDITLVLITKGTHYTYLISNALWSGKVFGMSGEVFGISGKVFGMSGEVFSVSGKVFSIYAGSFRYLYLEFSVSILGVIGSFR